MKPTLTIGVRGESRHRVVTQNLLSAIMEGGPPVFATPWMLCVMETAAAEALIPHLDEGESSVGVGFDFQHLAPTPAGMLVIGTAEVIQIDQNKITLAIEARDDVEVIGRGTHVRAIVDMERFKKRLQRKLG
ncbi:MAG: thioesterase family protein [Planctomycetota bacterium]|nr:thioesterase family protein [Planctomycetota bacterium]